MENMLAGKKGLIMGVANDRSIAWGIAQQLHQAGAELGFTYFNDMLEKRVRPLAESVGATFIEACDVSEDDSIKTCFEKVKEQWGEIDFIVHAIAFADKECLRNDFVHTTREQFSLAMDASAYSLLAVTKEATPLMKEGSNILTLTYLGSQRIIPNYNVMGVAKAALEATTRYLAGDLGQQGIRVNAISAGPMKTLAASAIGDFKKMLNHDAEISPLRRNVTQEDVGKSALYLLSDLSSGVTGEILYVDCGASLAGGISVDEEAKETTAA